MFDDDHIKKEKCQFQNEALMQLSFMVHFPKEKMALERSLIETRVESPVVTVSRFKIIESVTISLAAILLATAVKTTSRLTSKRKRTEVGSVGQYSDNQLRALAVSIIELHNVANIFAKKLETYLSTIVNDEVERFYLNDKLADKKYKIEHEKCRKNFLFKQYEKMADKKIISEILSRQLKYRIIESIYYNEYIDTTVNKIKLSTTI
ncbi:hypothetical protein Glove_510g3 [Diversispora epigaea]|uniref:Uncharacterized protein n=1 Tax=Diversispora epigaea TaxID=1348612 RepID=A0A397GG21_9GLOM|nr:hypothetical protein Glove_510g3 [Diversispora epigaea]